MPRLRFTPIALVLSSIFSTQSFATETAVEENNRQDDIVISASRIESKRIESGSSITVLDEHYLKENQARSVAEVLQDVPGLSVNRNGGFGKTTTVFIRGANSNQTLIIIDGVEVTDLSNMTGGYDLSNLMAANVERIEVLKGSQSALWGSDAMGGVINIVTKKGQGELNGSADFEFGSDKFNKQNINVNGATATSHYSLSASNLETDGISAKDEENGGKQADAYENQTIALKAGHQFNETFAIDGVMRYSKSESDYDASSGDADNYSKNRQRLAKVNAYLNLLNKQWQNRASVAYSDSNNQWFEPAGWNSYTEAEGQKVKADLQSTYYLQTMGEYSQHITLLAETEQDEYENASFSGLQEMKSSGIVAEYGIDWAKTIFFNAAIRHDFNDRFDDTTTHHIDISAWVSDGTRLHASQGTGVKNPTFGQMFGENAGWGYIGNPDLQPETSDSWDAGVEYNFESLDGYVDLTYFDSRYTDMHAYYSDPETWQGTYINLEDEATARGVELTVNLRVATDLRVNAGYTYSKTSDGSADDKTLLRRPKNTASINANYKYTDKLSANIGARYVGERRDSVYGEGDLTLDSYTVVNIAAAYQVHKRVSIYGRIENAFDTDYVNITGYSTEPLSAYLGVSFK